MVRIAIAEDEAVYANQLQTYLEQYASQSGQCIQCTVYTDGDELVEHYKSQFDILLLDVEMKYLDGMTAAEEIRKTDPEVVIIFITNMAQYAIGGYAVDAMDYVLKPVSYFAFTQRLDRAISRMNRRAPRYLSIAVRGGTQKMEIASIYYIESQGHNLLFHTTTEQYTTAGTMKEAEQRLEAEGFFRCNKGYLVNLHHVEGVRDGCAMVGGHELLISRSRKNEFLQALANHVGEVIK